MRHLNNDTKHQVDTINGSFLFGSTFTILKNPVKFLSNLSANYGAVVIIRFAGKKFYVLQHPDYIKHVLLDNYKQYNKPGATKILGMFLGEGLSTSNGELWLRQRRLMQPAFHSQKLKYYTEIINEEVTIFINKLNKVPDHSTIDINHKLLELTIRIISRSMFSMHFNDEINTMVKALEELASFAAAWMKSSVKIPTGLPTTANKNLKKNCTIFDKIIYTIIERRRKDTINGQTPENQDLLDLLLNYCDDETKTPLSEKLLRDEVTTIFMAGHETTAQTLSWMFYHLAKDKQINEKVKAESENVCSNNPVLLEDIPKLGYAKQVIRETLRLYPPIWALVRKTISDDSIHAMHLPAHSNILLNIYGLHRHPGYWDRPEDFYPEHFNEINEKARPAFVFVPFGGGPRLCLGHNFAMLVMQIILCRIAPLFEFSVPENYVPIVEPNITLRAKQGIRLKIKKLSTSNNVPCCNNEI